MGSLPVDNRLVDDARPEMIVTSEPERTAATLLVQAIVAADRANGGARLAIAGGSAARALTAARERLPADVWARTKLTWVDERCVPFASPESNRGEAYRSGALSDATPPAVELALTRDGESVSESLARVHATLREVFGAALDVTLLGMGPDGHIASLFPGHSAAAEASRDTLVAHVADSPKPPASRITMTRALLATAKTHVLLAAGEGKRWALEQLLLGNTTLPAVGLAGLVIVTDVDLGESASSRRAI